MGLGIYEAVLWTLLDTQKVLAQVLTARRLALVAFPSKVESADVEEKSKGD